MTKQALVIGGTGPTGPLVVEELISLGFEPTILHRGTHEIEALRDDLEHIHADPHFAEAMDDALAGRSFEVAVASYGRLRLTAQALIGKCEHFIGISGVAAYPGYFTTTDHSVTSRLLRPEAMNYATETDAPSSDHRVRAELSRCCPSHGFTAKILDAESAVLANAAENHYTATILRYPMLYGPRNLTPWEWHVVRRVLSNRNQILLPEGGHQVHSRLSAWKAASVVGQVLSYRDQIEDGVYNCSDVNLYSLRQWVERIGAMMGTELEVHSVPFPIAGPARHMLPYRGATSTHAVVSTEKIRNSLSATAQDDDDVWLERTIEWVCSTWERNSPQWERNIGDYNPNDDDHYLALIGELNNRHSPVGILTEPAQTMPMHPYPHPSTPGESTDQEGR